MPRLFVGNFSFEHQQDAGNNPTQQVIRLEAELACIWLAVARDGDEILAPTGLESDFLERMAQLGCPRIRPLTPQQLKASTADEIVPWGWTPDIHRLAERLKIQTHTSQQAIIWQANSRVWAFETSQEIGCLLPGEGVAKTLKEALALLVPLSGTRSGWIVKPNHGQAGRGQIRGTEIPTGKTLATLKRLIDRQGAVHIEPFVAKILELGGQWQIPDSGSPELLGLTQLQTDARGTYVGTGIDVLSLPNNVEKQLLTTQSEVAARLQALGYVGPVGIDAMLFRGEEAGPVQLRPVQDINARWTMGRIAWEWSCWRGRELGRTRQAGIWSMQPQSPAPSAIPLSPEVLDAVLVKNRTWWIDESGQSKFDVE